MSRTRIKICGLYREQHVDYVNAAGPDYAGFVFYPPSHRYVDREMMKRLREKLSHKIPAVGVFVNVPMEEVASYIEEGLIEIAQLHGGGDRRRHPETSGYWHRKPRYGKPLKSGIRKRWRRPRTVGQTGSFLIMVTAPAAALTGSF